MGNVVTSCCGFLGDAEDEVDESKLHFLHGALRVRVVRAEGLPDTDTAFFNIQGKDTTDPYVVGELGTARLFKTKYVANDVNPKWDETFDTYVCHHANVLDIAVKDKEHVGAAYVASCALRVESFIGGQDVSGWFDLFSGDKAMGRIELEVKYTPKDELEEMSTAVVRHAYFPATDGNRVVLYQDADTPALPELEGVLHPDGSPYAPTTAWKDLFRALKGAERFIYITGWSVHAGINLVRGDDDPDGESNVGELLKAKAAAGVKVMLLVWNEKLSTDDSPGLMGTHDEETRAFFEGTDVECLLISRAKREGLLASEFVGSCYTHHQKTVVCDAAAEDGSGRKRVVAFIGGLDITDGRYDSPLFPLWSTIQGPQHSSDFYNNCIPGVTKDVGPREPWHDCHAFVSGPAAVDIMKNFEERCRRQAEGHVQSLFRLTDEEFVPAETPAALPEHEGGPWSVQLLRSITSDSCVFDFERHDKLHRKYGKLVERSIMNCMVQHIRSADRFIYMENQYFLGSAYSWYGDRDTLTMHVIPREISQKIIEKIASGEDFKVYVLIPMFPEGDPSSAPIQEILYWQWRTMETMYRRIGKAIAEFGVEDRRPVDYLSFYCLGKRESPDEMPEGVFAEPESGSGAEAARKTRRHSVYVHSKMSIFDDKTVLLGSANVNQRSLGGNRDTECAVFAWQNEDGDGGSATAEGGVRTYRMALWAAHLGGADDAYLDPGSDDCLAKVRDVTSNFWDVYTGKNPEHSSVHMLPYPVMVGDDGRVTALPAPWDCFPDTQAKVLGSKSGYLPVKLTT